MSIKSTAKLFLASTVFILSLTAAAKIISAAGHAPILNEIDQLLKIQYRYLLYCVSGAELAVVFFLCFGRNLLLKMVSVAWLSFCFIIYRFVSARMGMKTCPCLGTLTDNLPLSHATLNAILIASLIYMFTLSMAYLIYILLNRKIMITKLVKTSVTFSFIICSLCIGCKSAPKAPDWEYTEIFLAPGQSLNVMADKGWFVVNAFYDTENKNTHFLLKRLKNGAPTVH